MSSKVLETTYKIYKGQGNYLNKMEIFFFFVCFCLWGGGDERISWALLLILLYFERRDFFLRAKLRYSTQVLFLN